MSGRLEGLTAIVTGAGSGMGQATTRLFAAEGASVLAVARSDSAKAVAGGPVQGARCDVADESAVATLFEEFDGGLGPRLDVLVNCAGVGSFTTTPDTSLETWESVFAVNVRGVFLMCRAALPRLRKPGGAIVNVASVAGHVGIPSRAAYCASKGAVLAYTRALAIDHVDEGIRVNSVSPGTTDTAWIDRVVEEEGEAREDLVARQPLGRLGSADEMAEAILHMAQPASGFTTGSDLVVDGGMTAR